MFLERLVPPDEIDEHLIVFIRDVRNLGFHIEPSIAGQFQGDDYEIRWTPILGAYGRNSRTQPNRMGYAQMQI